MGIETNFGKMKKCILIFVLLFSALIYSQKNPVNEMDLIPGNSEYKNCVKNMIITNLYLSNSKDKNDTTKAISIIDFSRKGLIQQIKSYYSAYGNSWKISVFDKYGRVTTISQRKDNNIKIFVNQYFTGRNEFPDSTIINNYENYREKYINHFSNKLVIKQDHYVNDSLEDKRVYRYNNKNQIIEELYLNEENTTGETMVSDESNGIHQLSFYPERQTLYEYSKKKDTVITVKIQPKYFRKEVIKKINNEKYSLEIIEKYKDNQLDEFTSTRTSEGMISKVHNRYNKNKHINNYYNTTTTDTGYIAKYTTYENEPESIYKTDIEVVYDKFNNWVKKIYSNNKIISTIIERKIEYYCR